MRVRGLDRHYLPRVIQNIGLLSLSLLTYSLTGARNCRMIGSIEEVPGKGRCSHNILSNICLTDYQSNLVIASIEGIPEIGDDWMLKNTFSIETSLFIHCRIADRCLVCKVDLVIASIE